MLHVERSGGGDELRLVLRGKITLMDTPGLRKLMLGTIEESAGGVIVDLGDVGFLDSSGVAVLVEGWRKAQDSTKSFVLLDPSPAVMRVLELSQLDEIFDIRSSR